MRIVLISVASSLILSLTISAAPAEADLGAAESSRRVFNAWCERKKNDCTVVFQEGRMRVDNGSGITPSQVVSISIDQELRGFWDRTPGNYYYPVYFVTYKKPDGSMGTGKFLFINENSGQEFWQAVKNFSQMSDPLEAQKESLNESRESSSANRFNSLLQNTNNNLDTIRENSTKDTKALIENKSGNTCYSYSTMTGNTVTSRSNCY